VLIRCIILKLSSECANQMHHFETAYLNEYLITSEIGFPMYAGQIENTSR